MADVARLANVSTMTASRALRNAADCHPETRERVLKAADELGYRVNPIVSLFQSMVRRRSSHYRATIGWINDFPNQGYHLMLPYELPYWEGARKRASSLGFVLEEIWIGEGGCRNVETLAARARRIIESRGIPALILPFLLNPRLALVPWEGFSVASIGPLYPEPDEKRVVIESFPECFHHAQADYFANMQLAIHKLHHRGYRRIGLMLSDWLRHATGRRYEGAFLACQQEMDPTERIPVWEGDLADCNMASMRFWLTQWKPDCVLCCVNQARGLLESAGLQVPRDIGLVHLSIADDVRNWSGIDPGHERLGAAAVDLVIQQMQSGDTGYPSKPMRQSFMGDWVDGQTTRPASA